MKVIKLSLLAFIFSLARNVSSSKKVHSGRIPARVKIVNVNNRPRVDSFHRVNVVPEELPVELKGLKNEQKQLYRRAREKDYNFAQFGHPCKSYSLDELEVWLNTFQQKIEASSSRESVQQKGALLEKLFSDSRLICDFRNLLTCHKHERTCACPHSSMGVNHEGICGINNGHQCELSSKTLANYGILVAPETNPVSCLLENAECAEDKSSSQGPHQELGWNPSRKVCKCRSGYHGATCGNTEPIKQQGKEKFSRSFFENQTVGVSKDKSKSTGTTQKPGPFPSTSTKLTAGQKVTKGPNSSGSSKVNVTAAKPVSTSNERNIDIMSDSDLEAAPASQADTGPAPIESSNQTYESKVTKTPSTPNGTEKFNSQFSARGRQLSSTEEDEEDPEGSFESAIIAMLNEILTYRKRKYGEKCETYEEFKLSETLPDLPRYDLTKYNESEIRDIYITLKGLHWEGISFCDRNSFLFCDYLGRCNCSSSLNLIPDTNGECRLGEHKYCVLEDEDGELNYPNYTTVGAGFISQLQCREGTTCAKLDFGLPICATQEDIDFAGEQQKRWNSGRGVVETPGEGKNKNNSPSNYRGFYFENVVMFSIMLVISIRNTNI